jgi:LytS/YehU family sensor histidine kinase
MIDKPLDKLIGEGRDSILIIKIRNEKGEITTEIKEIQKYLQILIQSLYSTKLKILNEMDNFLDRYEVPNLNQDQKN